MYNVTATPFKYHITQYVCLCFRCNSGRPSGLVEKMHTRFRKLTRHHSGNDVRELMNHNKYFLKKLQFLERHMACMPGLQTGTPVSK